MKYAILSLLLMSCGDEYDSSKPQNMEYRLTDGTPVVTNIRGGFHQHWEVATIDGHEYIARYNAGIVHSESCPNSKHK